MFKGWDFGEGFLSVVLVAVFGYIAAIIVLRFMSSYMDLQPRAANHVPVRILRFPGGAKRVILKPTGGNVWHEQT